MADEGKTKTAFCPSCQQPAIRQGNEVICETCDATFTITKKEGAKVKRIGRIEQIERDVAEIRAQVFDQEPEPEPAPDSDDDEGKDSDDDENGDPKENEDDW